jgi:hypothetical protein
VETRFFNSALLEPGSDGVPFYLVALSLTRADGTPCLEADFPLGQSFLASFWQLTAASGMVARTVILGPFDFSGVNRKRIAHFAHDTIHCVLSGSASAPVLRKPALCAAR